MYAPYLISLVIYIITRKPKKTTKNQKESKKKEVCYKQTSFFMQLSAINRNFII